MQADMDSFVDDVEENVESFLSQDDADPRDTAGPCMDVSKGNLDATWLTGLSLFYIFELIES